MKKITVAYISLFLGIFTIGFFCFKDDTGGYISFALFAPFMIAFLFMKDPNIFNI